MKIYNYYTKKKEEFKTIKEGEFKMYVCGITPYDSPHIGHIMVALRFNIVRNYLFYKGYKGVFVENITDIDDKIINRAKKEGVSHSTISSKYIEEYKLVLASFNIKKPDYTPRVTEYIDKIIVYIQELIDKDYAYATKKGNVYFDVSKKSDYGKLSNKNTEDLQSKNGEEGKRNSLDFALWKSEEQEGFSWTSPWGKGRPGWHIECSVMSNDILGETIDIHGGGLDLNFPHHENELAQCEAHNDKPYVNYWMYSALLNIDGVKMSKSLGNFITAKDCLKKYGAELLIYAINTVHYRSDFKFQDKIFINNLNNIANFHKMFIFIEDSCDTELNLDGFEVEEIKEIIDEFLDSMDEDFNTVKAIVSLNRLLLFLTNKINSNFNEKEIVYAYKKLKELGGILNLFHSDNSENILDELLAFYSQCLDRPKLTVGKINTEIKRMREAIEIKDYSLSDDIRNGLLEKGIKIIQKDNKNTYWKFNLHF